MKLAIMLKIDWEQNMVVKVLWKRRYYIFNLLHDLTLASDQRVM